VSEISGPTVQIYMGGQGAKRLPVQKKYVFGAPFHHFYFAIAKKSGGLGTPEKQTFCAPD